MTVSVKEYFGDFIAANGLFEDDERPVLPEVTVTPDSIKGMMINEMSPKNPADDFYAAGTPDYMATTKTLFESAGIDIETAAIF